MNRLALVISALTLVGCEGSPDMTVQPIVGGTRDTADPAVMLLGHFSTDGKVLNGCTAFVVSDRVAITAAHCFDTVKDGETVKLFAGSDGRSSLGSPAGWLPVTEWKLPFEYGSAAWDHDPDIAVVAAQDPLPAEPIAMTDALDMSIVGKTMRLVGYGETVPGQGSSAFAKYEVTNTITNLYPSYVATDEPNGYCHGDSGGPELVSVGGHEVAIALMDRRGSSPDGGACQGNSRAIRLDVWRTSLIDPFIAEHPVGMAQPDMDTETPPAQEGGCAMAPAGRSTAGMAMLVLALITLILPRRAS